MTTSDPTPTVEVKPFHKSYPGMPELYHTYCSACPDYGTCDELNAAESSAKEHERWHAESAQTGDRDELLAEWDRHDANATENIRRGYGFIAYLSNDDTAALIEALRTEQSARQAAEAMWDDALTSGRQWKAQTDALQQRMTIAEAIISRAAYCTREEYPREQVLAVLQNPLPPLTAPTESKEASHE